MRLDHRDIVQSRRKLQPAPQLTSPLSNAGLARAPVHSRPNLRREKQKARFSQRAFEGEKAHGHCAVGLELFPRPQCSGVQESSQAGKAKFKSPSSLLKTVSYG